MDAIIFAGGNISGYLKTDDLIICVDSGCEFPIKNNLPIHKAIGDFDSISKEDLDFLLNSNTDISSFNRDKDMTDLELAINYAIENKVANLKIYGATGSRLDHSLSSIFGLSKYSKYFNTLQIIDKKNTVFYLDKDCFLDKRDGLISFLPTDEKCVFSVKGTKWELEEHHLEYGSSLTVSNEIVDDVYITIKKGSLFVILTSD